MSIKLSSSDGHFRGPLVNYWKDLREADKKAPMKGEAKRKDSHPSQSKLSKLADAWRPAKSE